MYRTDLRIPVQVWGKCRFADADLQIFLTGKMQIFSADFFSADYGVKCIGPKCIRETKLSVIKTWP